MKLTDRKCSAHHSNALLDLPEERLLGDANFAGEMVLVSSLIPWSPLFGIAVALIAFSFGMFLVNLGTFPHEFVFSELLSVRYFVMFLSPIIFLVGYKYALQYEMTGKGNRNLRYSPPAVIAVLCILGAGWLISQTPIQWFFLQSVWIRAEPNSLERSAVNWKLGLERAEVPSQESVSLVGSSQISFAVDEVSLQASFPQVNFLNNVLPGFGILQYLMMTPIIEGQHAKLVICLLSEFDAFRDRRIPTERMRYFGEWPEKLQLIRLMSAKLIWSNRSELADLMMANVTSFWRDRDLFRLLAQSAWWKAPPRIDVEKDEDQKKMAILEHGYALKTSIGRTALLDLNFEAFEKFAKLLHARGTELWVFEGMTNPAATNIYDPDSELRTEARERFSAMAKKIGFSYVTSSEMPAFTELDFADALHLNKLASERFTHYLAAKMCDSMCLKESPNY